MKLDDYHHFSGRDWERGSLANAFAYHGIGLPGAALNEAALLGISGGAVFGYFTFAYAGYDPHAALVINNTFTPFETILKRLDVRHDEHTTGRAPRAVEHLQAALAAGSPAIVWADIYGMPYNLLDPDENNWAMLPVVVYGYDPQADQVWIADRSGAPLTVTTGDLAAARARTGKHKHRLVTLKPGALDERRVREAITAGLRDSAAFMIEGAPKGAKDNWGLAALEKWAALLVDSDSARGWPTLFGRGSALYNGLLTAFYSLELRGVGEYGAAGRGIYADCLDSAAALLEKPALGDAAAAYRAAVPAWKALAAALLPDSVPLLAETRQLETQARALFIADGMGSMDARTAIKTRLGAIKEEARESFPLDDAGAAGLYDSIRAAVLAVHAAESDAARVLQTALA
ncbi:MAG: BtrH N-terminal domain-containing protein [bacterium]|nr:BtrH N-terminal domain-containing protein [bacterium]